MSMPRHAPPMLRTEDLPGGGVADPFRRQAVYGPPAPPPSGGGIAIPARIAAAPDGQRLAREAAALQIPVEVIPAGEERAPGPRRRLRTG
jgi:hypothetical protein